MTLFKPHWREDLTNEQYHGFRDFYSSSQLKIAVEESLEAFYLSAHYKKVKAQTNAMRLGTIIHSAVLEGDDFVKRYIIQPDFSMHGHANSHSYKAAKKEWRDSHPDKIIVTQDELEMINGVYASILKHPDAMLLLKDCLFERSGFFHDSDTALPVRVRYDAYDPAGRILCDLKSVQSVKSKKFSDSILKYRWDFSMAMYGQGIEALDTKGPDDYVFIAVEKTAPYHCAVYHIAPRTIEIGLRDYRAALRKVAEAKKTKVWTPYQTEMQIIDLPKWFEGRANV